MSQEKAAVADVQASDDDLLVIWQAAEYLGIAESTLRRYHLDRPDFPKPAHVNPLARNAGVFYRRGDLRQYRERRIAELESGE